MSLYLENTASTNNDETADRIAYASIILNMAAFIFEVGLNYYENAKAQAELQEAKTNFTSTQTVFNNVVSTTVTPTISKFKTYGLKNNPLLHVVNASTLVLNAGSNVVNLLAKAGPVPKTSANIPVLVTNLVSVSIQWLHQHYIQHNLAHEERLYKAARNHILNTITQAQQGIAVANNAPSLSAPQNAALIIYQR